MKTMKRLLALLLALAMVMPNCLTIASAYDEEIVEEVVEELVEEVAETPEEEVEEVFEEVYEEEIYEEEPIEEIPEEVTEEVAEEVTEVIASITDDVAAEQVTAEAQVQVLIPEVPYDSDALFEDYATSVLYPGGPVTMGSDGFDELDEQGQELYNALASVFKKIADGEQSETKFSVNLSYAADIDQLSLVVDAMMMDMPYNLYWYDKTEGVVLYSETGEPGNYQQIIGFAVGTPYATEQLTNEKLPDGAKDFHFHADTTKTSLVPGVVAYAQEVADTVAFQEYGSTCETSYDKLMAYVNWICRYVSYDKTAAGGGDDYFSVTDINPWQIIYVFDRNEDGTMNQDTNVVCEGYSKALQYLCDIATDNDVPHVFSVSGDMQHIKTDGTEGGRHMWNIAVMDGQNYLVDVTNQDGNAWNVILLGGNYEDIGYKYTDGTYAYTAQRYTFDMSPHGTLTYEYDQDTMTLFADDLAEITLAAQNYAVPEDEGGSSDNTVTVSSAEALVEALETANATGGTVVLNGNVEVGELEVGPNATLVVAEGSTLAVTKADIYGTVNVEGTIFNNFNITMRYDGASKLNVTGTYSGTGKVSVSTDTGNLPEISGVPETAKSLEVIAESAQLLETGLGYAGDYGTVRIILKGDAAVTDLEIPENVTLDVCSALTINGTLTNYGVLMVNNGGSLVRSANSAIYNYKTITIDVLGFMVTDPSATMEHREGGTITKQYDLNANANLENDVTLNNGGTAININRELIISDGATLTINGKLNICDGGSITVEAGGTLLINEQVVMESGSALTNGGSVTVGENGAVSVADGATVTEGTWNGTKPTYAGEATDNTMTQAEFQAAIEGLTSYQLTKDLTLESDLQIMNFSLYVDGGSITVPADMTLEADCVMVVRNGGVLNVQGELDLTDSPSVNVTNGSLSVAAGATVVSPEKIAVHVDASNHSHSGLNNGDIAAVRYVSTFTGMQAAYANADNYKIVRVQPRAEFSITENITVTADDWFILTATGLDTGEDDFLDITIPNGVTLTVDGTMNVGNGHRVNVEEGGQIVVNGTLNVTIGTLVNQGTVRIAESGTVNQGTLGENWQGKTPVSGDTAIEASDWDTLVNALNQGSGTTVTLTEALSVNEYLEIPADVTLEIPSGVELTIAAGVCLRNEGSFVAQEGSVIHNNGILENDSNGNMGIHGTYNHNGELKIYTRQGENGLEINDIDGVDNDIKTIVTNLHVTETDQLNIMDQGFAFGNTYGQAQVHMTGTPHFIYGLHLNQNWDLHIYGDAIIDGNVTVEGGQLQVEPDGSLTANNEIALFGGARMTVNSGAELVTNGAVWINGGSYVDNEGTWNANKAIHIGYQNQINAPVSGVLDVDGTLNTKEYVNICEDAQLIIDGTMTQENVILENHGSITVNGVLNQGWEIYNEGEMTVNGGLNTNSCLHVQNDGVLTTGANAVLTFSDNEATINIWEKGTLNNSADLTGKGTCINILPWEATEFTGVPAANIYATYFVHSEEELTDAISDAVAGGYGFAEFMPKESFRINGAVSIPAGTIMQLWEHGKPINVTVSNGASLTTAMGGGIIINPETRLNIEQGGVLNNNGFVNVTNNTRGEEGLAPGILWYYNDEEGNWDCLEGNDINTDPENTPEDTADDGFTVDGTMTQAELEAVWESVNKDEKSCGWTHEAVTTLTGGLTLSGKNFFLDDYGTIVVPDGKTLTINNHFKLIGGKIIVEKGGKLINNGTLEILEGSVYIASGGYISDGDYRGYLTFEDGEDHSSTNAYLSTYWVHNFGEGAFVNHDYQENRGFRMVPGEQHSWIFYYNEWDSTNLTWTRIPVHPDDLNAGDYVKIEPASNYEWLAKARPDYEHLKDYFVMVSIEDVEEAWDQGTVVRYQHGEDVVDYGIDICRDSERGFYKEADATDGNWLFEVQTAPVFADEDGTKSFYFIYTREGHTISNVALNTEDTFATLTEVEDKTNTWKITLSKDYVDSLWKHKIERDDRLEVTYTETNSNGDSSTNSADIGIQAIWPTTEAGFTLVDKEDVFEGYNYDAETGKWIDSYDGGWRIIEGLPEGISYDYASNTLTLNNAQLNGMHLYYRDDQGNKLLSNPNLTIHLVGESSITNYGVGQSLIIGSGVKATITGDGVLNLGSTNADSINTAIDVTPESSLTLAGGTINTNNANLMLGGVVTLDGATVTTTGGQIHVEKQLDLKSGELNVTAAGHAAPHNENPDVMHTHYEGIVVSCGNTLNINGGELNITVPKAETVSQWGRGIKLEAANLNINGGVTTIDIPENTWACGIELGGIYDEAEQRIEGYKSTFTMNGGELVMEEAMIVPDEDLATFIGGDHEAEVTVNGGKWTLNSVYVDLNGKTIWNKGTVNGNGVLFLAGGESFVINDGEFNLTGNMPEGMNALFRASGEVVMNGGTMNITNGVLGVPTSFNLNGGNVTITNNEDFANCWGLYVGNYMSINAGSLTVNVPGGENAPHETITGMPAPAAWIDGTFHQMGGTVTLTSDTTAAIRSHGSVLLNGGTMNLNGLYGIGQFGEGYAEDMGKFEVSGGVLNIDAADTGIFAQNSSVRFVKGRNEDGSHISDPTVTIEADGAAIQMLSDTDYEQVYINEYTFVDADGKTLELPAIDRTGEDAYKCYVHTLLKNGATSASQDDYARYATIAPGTETITTQGEWDELTGDITEGFFVLARNILIKGDITISGYNVHLRDNAVMTIAENASVTIQNYFTESGIFYGGSLAAQGNSKIIVQSGGKIHNEGATLAADMGSITFEEGASYTTATAPDGTIAGSLNVHYNNGALAKVTGVADSYKTLKASISNMDQYDAVMALAYNEADEKIYGSVSIDTVGDLTINRVETLKVPLFVGQNTTLTIAEGVTVVIPENGLLSAYNANLVINGKLIAKNGAGLSVNSARVTIGPNGELENNIDQIREGEFAYGGLTIQEAIMNVQGKLTNKAYMALNVGTILTINGQMENDGFLMIGAYGENNQLNVNGTLNSYNPIQVGNEANREGARINIGSNGVVNVFAGDINNHGLVNVSGALNVNNGGYLNQNGTMLVPGIVNLFASMDNNGRTVLESTENDSARMNVLRGGRLDLVDGGIFHVEDGATLANGNTIDEEGNVEEGTNGDVRIRMGTLYIFEGGNIAGYWDGDITREGISAEENRYESTASYLAVAWLDGENGWHIEPEWGLNRDMRIMPGRENFVVFLENTWNSDENCWDRNQVNPADISGYEALEYIQVDTAISGCFINLTAPDSAWNTDETLTYNGLEFPVRIGADAVHGFYANKEGTDWLEEIVVDTLNPVDTKVYFVLTDDNWDMTGQYNLEVPEDIVVTSVYLDNSKAIEITIPADTIRNMTDEFWMQMNYQVVNTDNKDDIRNWGFGVKVFRKDLSNLETNTWLRINNEDYNYNAENEIWISEGNLTVLPEGLSYDYASNTLTMADANLASMEVGYYGLDGDYYDLPNPKLTIKLEGSSMISSSVNSSISRDSALRIYRGAQVEITGDGSLYLVTHHDAEGFHNEDNTEFWSCPAIAVSNEGSSLTISGNAQVTAEVTGRAYYMENGVKMGGDIRVIGGGGTNALTIQENAYLMTIVPEGAVHQNHWITNTGYTGGYRGIADFHSITVKDNARVDTQDLDVFNGEYIQTGGDVKIRALQYLNPHDEDENVNHTHVTGLRTQNGEISVTGGKLTIDIPEPTTGSESDWYFAMDLSGGELTIGGNANVTINAVSMGEGIKLNDAVMSLNENAELNFRAEPFVETVDGKVRVNYTKAIASNNNSQVFMNGGTINATAANFDFNGASSQNENDGITSTGKTDWNGTTLTGSMVYFGAGGTFNMNGGQIRLSGEQYNDDLFIESTFNPYGMVQINEGAVIDLTDGVMAVGNGTSLNGGTITIHNTYDQMEGLYVKSYFAINDGELNVTVPGGKFVSSSGNTVHIPAVWIDGTLHQMGGKVNFQVTNDETTESAAIASYGSVLMNGGEMTLSGHYGIQQLGQEEKQMFYVSGGELIIEAVDTGVYAEYSDVCFVRFDENDTEIPEVTIHAGEAAMQVVTGTEDDSRVTNDYAFYNEAGDILSLKAEKHEHTDEETKEVITYYAHTLMDGDKYALKASLDKDRSMSEAEFLAAMNAAAAEKKPLVVDGFVTITQDVTLNTIVIFRDGGRLTVKSGTLTIPEGFDLAAEENGKIVFDGGILRNEGMLAANKGSIQILTEKGYSQSETAKVDRWYYADTKLSEIVGIELAQQTVRANVVTADQLQGVNGIEKLDEYGAVEVGIYADMSLLTYSSHANTTINVVGGHTVTIPEGAIVSNGGDLFVHEDAELIVEGTLHNQKNLFAGNKYAGSDRSSGTVRVSSGGKLTNNGMMEIYDSVVVQGEVENNAGIFMTADEASFVTDGGTITNNVCISTEATKATIDFTNGTYVQGSKVFDDTEYAGELDSDYFADGTTSNVKVNDMSKVTLRYAVTDITKLDAFMAAAEGYGNYILAFAEDTEIPADTTITVDEGSYLTVKPGKTLTNNGYILNKGYMYLGKDNDGTVANLINNGTLENNPGATMKLLGEYTHNGKVYVGLKGDGSMSKPTGNITDDMMTIVTGINGHADPAAHLKMAAELDISAYAGMEIHLFKDVTIDSNLTLTGGNKKALLIHDGATLTVAKGAALREGRVEVLSGGKIQVDGEYVVPNTLVKSGADFTIGTKGLLNINNSGFNAEKGSTLTNNGTIDNNSSFGEADTVVFGEYTHGKNAVVLTQKHISGMDKRYQTLVMNVTSAADINALASKASGYAGSIANIRSGELTVSDALTIPAGMELNIGTTVSGAGLIVNAELTVDGKLTICQWVEKEGTHVLTNNDQVVISENGVLANYDTIINTGTLTVNGTMDPYGTVINNGTMNGEGTFGGTCGADLTWKLTGSTLTISGTGKMTSTPWDKLTGFVDNVKTVKLSAKLESIADNAFIGCAEGVSILIPRAVETIGNNAFAVSARLKVYHNSPAESILQTGFDYIHEIDPDDGSCTVEDCKYNISEMMSAAKSEKTSVEEKIDAVTDVDTSTLKKQIQEELKPENGNGSSEVLDTIQAVEEAIKKAAEEEEKQLSVGVSQDTNVIGVVRDDAIVGALLSASEDTTEVTLVVSDAEDVPVVDTVDRELSANSAVPFEMTLEGVDDPENLVAPVTVTLPIPSTLLGKVIRIVHHGFNGTEIIEPLIVGKYATFAVDGFSTFEYRTEAVAYAGVETNTYDELQAAIDTAEVNSTVTLLKPYEGAGVKVNKALIIDPKGNTLSRNQISVAEGFKLVEENGTYQIVALKQISEMEITLGRDLTYNGSEQTKEITICDGDQTLTVGEDYTVTGNTATSAGGHTMTITGKGDYAGTSDVTWTIAQADLTVTLPTLEKIYGESDPDIKKDIQLTGWIAENAQVQYEITRENKEDVGNYELGAKVTIVDETGDKTGNYDITVGPGNLTIQKAVITVDVNHEVQVMATPGSIDKESCTIADDYKGDKDKLLAELNLSWSGDTSQLNAEYDIRACGSYTESDNYEVTLTGKIKIVLGDYVCQNENTGVYYKVVNRAVNEANKDHVIKMLTDSDQTALGDIDDTYPADQVLMTKGVTLNLQSYTLKLNAFVATKGNYVFGARGSDLNKYGKVIVHDPDSVIIKSPYNGNVIPVWYPDYEDIFSKSGEKGCYIFSQFALLTTDSINKRGLRVDETAERIEFIFNHNATTKVKTALLGDEKGPADNRLEFKVVLSWDQVNENGEVEGTRYQNFIMSPSIVQYINNNDKNDYQYYLTGYPTLNIKLKNMRIKAVVESNCGTEFCSEEISGVKAKPFTYSSN